MSNYDLWAKDNTWSSGPRTGSQTKLTPTEAQIRQGQVGGTTFATEWQNWVLEQIMDNLNAELFGTGVDGAVVYGSGTHTLSQSVYATTVDIQSGATVRPFGSRIFATESITITGDIDTVTYTEWTSGGAGVGGGLSGIGGFGADCLGGNGGGGGNGSGGGGGSGGVADLPPLGHPKEIILMSYRRSGDIIPYRGGAGGGSGGGGGSGTSGSGGWGGEIIMLAAPEIIWNGGTLTAQGGPGGNATGGSGAGGGGGGGGGIAVVLRRRVTGTPLYDLAGGAAGSGDGAGANGIAGAAGVSYDIEV